MKLIERLKSPVVIIQLISIVAGAVVVLAPEIADQVKIIVGTVVAVINILSGLNNPTDKEEF